MGTRIVAFLAGDSHKPASVSKAIVVVNGLRYPAYHHLIPSVQPDHPTASKREHPSIHRDVTKKLKLMICKIMANQPNPPQRTPPSRNKALQKEHINHWFS